MFSAIKYFITLVIITVFTSCNNGVKSYIKWYEAQAPYEIKIEGGKVQVKEITPEVSMIGNYGAKLTGAIQDSFYKALNIAQFEFTLVPDLGKQFNKPLAKDLVLECGMDGESALDVLYEGGNSSNCPQKFIVVFNKEKTKKGTMIKVAHPAIKEIIKVPVQKIYISPQKKLSL